MTSTMSSVTPTSYCCEICGQEGLIGDDEVRTHMLLVHIDEAISCPFCDLNNISPNSMLLHVNTAHLDNISPDDVRGGGSVSAGCDQSRATPEKFSKSDAVSYSLSTLAGEPCGADQSSAACRQFGSDITNDATKCKVVASSPRLKRSMLTLDLEASVGRSNEGDNCISAVANNRLADGLMVECPICGHCESSPTRLEEHVNRSHFDLMSPSHPADVHSPSNRKSLLGVGDFFDCPLCSRRFTSVADLELHVNVEHVLSPLISPSTAHSSSSISRQAVQEDENANQRCPVCDMDGPFGSAVMLARHIDDHFKKDRKIALQADPPEPPILESESELMSSDSLLAREIECQEHEALRSRECLEFQKLKAQYGMDGRGSFHDQSLAQMQRAVYNGEISVADFYNRQVQLKAAEMSGVDDGHSCTKGLVPKIRSIVMNCNRVTAAWLCTTVDHYGATYGDRGWGCGYRNIQMMLSSLVHNTAYNERLFNGQNAIPSISKIQELIEWSWRQGFDPQGCEQLGGSLLNTRKWIGATEVVSLLASFRIRCQLVDFHRPTGSDGSHPELFRWVAEYFQKQEDFKAPLYLQHQGHSRTVIGVEQLKDGCLRILLFDPSHSRRQMEAFGGNAAAMASGMRLIRRPLAAMTAKQYQVVAVTGVIESDREFKQNKILFTLRIPRDA